MFMIPKNCICLGVWCKLMCTVWLNHSSAPLDYTFTTWTWFLRWWDFPFSRRSAWLPWRLPALHNVARVPLVPHADGPTAGHLEGSSTSLRTLLHLACAGDPRRPPALRTYTGRPRHVAVLVSTHQACPLGGLRAASVRCRCSGCGGCWFPEWRWPGRAGGAAELGWVCPHRTCSSTIQLDSPFFLAGRGFRVWCVAAVCERVRPGRGVRVVAGLLAIPLAGHRDVQVLVLYHVGVQRGAEGVVVLVLLGDDGVVEGGGGDRAGRGKGYDENWSRICYMTLLEIENIHGPIWWNLARSDKTRPSNHRWAPPWS